MKLSSNQKNILSRLIKKYENSKTYMDENKVIQRFYIKPAEVMKNYNSDFADLDMVHDFDTDVQALSDEGIVLVQYKKNLNEIDKIYLNVDSVDIIRELIGVREKKEIISDEVSFYNKECKRGGFFEWYCQKELEKISNGKKSKYNIGETKIILNLADIILRNEDELLERELSIRCFGDTKEFEKKYRSKICRYLFRYMQETNQLIDEQFIKASSESEREHLILETYGIYQNPVYVFLKGRLTIKYKSVDGESEDSGSCSNSKIQTIEVSMNAPMAISNGIIKRLSDIYLSDRSVVTVENLTSFHKLKEPGTTYIYTGGYTGRAIKELLLHINGDNPDVHFYHFGDIDPDGFLILENLINTTRLDIKPIHMDKGTLEKYKQYTKRLTNQDIIKAEGLIGKGLYVDVLNHMINGNMKLEQEIVSG